MFFVISVFFVAIVSFEMLWPQIARMGADTG